MGRTRRKRSRKNAIQRSRALNHQGNLIELKKFMTRNGFTDEIKLKLRDFPATGRGISTLESLHENAILIRIPYDLMITFTTLQKVNFLRIFSPSSKLTMQDLLTTFLVLERQKNHSFWGDYINSLPSEPPWLPSLLSEEHVELLPADVRLEAKKSRRLLEESFARVKKSIVEWTKGCVIEWNLFTWGYILVNTRAVYVNPQLCKLCDSDDVLSDEPCMALCPFLDMFNHSYRARTTAELITNENGFFYQLTTLTRYKKYEQVFISYGDHDNVKLMMEYGFFIPGNCYDSIPIQSEDVFKVLKLSLSDCQYKFISKHGLDKSLSIGEAGPSFNLKAFLFVASRDKDGGKNFASVVYNEDYPEAFLNKVMIEMCRKLLLFLVDDIAEVLRRCENNGLHSDMIDFLKHRKSLIEILLSRK